MPVDPSFFSVHLGLRYLNYTELILLRCSSWCHVISGVENAHMLVLEIDLMLLEEDS